MIGKAAERNDLAALNAEEKQIEELISQQDARVIFALRKGEEISLEAEKEALRLRRFLSDIRRRKRALLKATADPWASASHPRSKQDSGKADFDGGTGSHASIVGGLSKRIENACQAHELRE